MFKYCFNSNQSLQYCNSPHRWLIWFLASTKMIRSSGHLKLKKIFSERANGLHMLIKHCLIVVCISHWRSPFCPVSADLLPALHPPHLPSHVPGHLRHVLDVQPANPETFSLKLASRCLRLDLLLSLSSLAGGRWGDAVREGASRRALLQLHLLPPSHLVLTPTSCRS